jgi:hypothetical protein
MVHLPNLSLLNSELLENAADIEKKAYEDTVQDRRKDAYRRQRLTREKQLQQARDFSSAEKERTGRIDTNGSRERITTLVSTNDEHLRVLAAMGYTRGYDKLVNLVASKSISPSAALVQILQGAGQSPLFGEKPSSRLATFLMFMNKSTIKNQFYKYLQMPQGDSYETNVPFPIFNDQAGIDERCGTFAFQIESASEYCAQSSSFVEPMVVQIPTCFKFVNGAQALQNALAANEGLRIVKSTFQEKNMLKAQIRPRLLDMWNDLNRYTETDTSRKMLARDIFDQSIYNMMNILNGCFENFGLWNLMRCRISDESITNTGSNVRYRGQQKNDSVIKERYNSTSSSMLKAYQFTGGKDDSSMHVFFFSPEARVMDIPMFLGFKNSDLICFREECEILIATGENYLPLTLDEVRLLTQTAGRAYKFDPRVTALKTTSGNLLKVFFWYVTNPGVETPDGKPDVV